MNKQPETVRTATAHIRADGTGFYYDCPKCHFYKNTGTGPCRRMYCGGTVIRVEFTHRMEVAHVD